MKKIYLGILITFGLALSAQGQKLPTIGMVFDFSVGDEFHYNHSAGSYGWWGFHASGSSRDKILDVQFSSDSNDVTYSIFREGYMSYYLNWDGTLDTTFFYSETLTETYSNLSSSMYYYNSEFTIDTIHYVSEPLCGVEIYGNACGPPDCGWGFLKKEWGIGLGKTWDQSSDGEGGGTLDSLSYYKKNGIECGTRVEVLVAINEIDIPENVEVFPTVFADRVWIRSDRSQSMYFSLYSISGKEVFSTQLNSDMSDVDLNFLDSGSYLFSIRNEKSVKVKSGIIIKE